MRLFHRGTSPGEIGGPVLVGIAALVAAALWGLWRTADGATGAAQIVIVGLSAPVLFFVERSALAQRRPRALAPALPPLLVALAVFVAATRAELAGVAFLAAWVAVLVVGWVRLGPATLLRWWFPIVYTLFLASPPNRVIFAVTHPLKLALTDWTVAIGALAGLDVGASQGGLQLSDRSVYSCRAARYLDLQHAGLDARPGRECGQWNVDTAVFIAAGLETAGSGKGLFSAGEGEDDVFLVADELRGTVAQQSRIGRGRP